MRVVLAISANRCHFGQLQDAHASDVLFSYYSITVEHPTSWSDITRLRCGAYRDAAARTMKAPRSSSRDGFF